MLFVKQFSTIPVPAVYALYSHKREGRGTPPPPPTISLWRAWPRKAEYYRRALPLAVRGHAPVFTHGDLQRKNLLLREDGTVVMLDWEAAGWYPSFWEYATAMFSRRWDDDWHSWVIKVLDEYWNEYAWMDMMFRELWP
ncbi:hypothetical protein S7711_03403 [Stachybotrys chartarum IBT 7711]|uniref:Aminoglycoside phosphotransferase domain-containing protein n=1 Tax=Stachybotrys chartarum (strain CBS 109288 / IBT 7711) TaxID=1280523 RepID=A0A084AY03_STACB|nr:hypothetical protein S7711_03403 [Stachybotrys chartarum IBT 7711]